MTIVNGKNDVHFNRREEKFTSSLTLVNGKNIKILRRSENAQV